MATIFSKIVKGEIPCHRLAENEDFLAFLDVNPLAKGHGLVIPKKEVDYIFDLEDDILGRMHVFSKKVAKGIEEVIPCERIGVVVLGLEVPHAHIHLIPINNEGDIDFKNPRLDLSQEELDNIAGSIRPHIQL